MTHKTLASTLTPQGTTLIPAEILHQMGASAGTRIVWAALPTGAVVVRFKTKSALDLMGSVKTPKGKRITIEDMSL